MDESDLNQESEIALWKASNDYDESLGAKFTTFAYKRIMWHLQRAIDDKHSTIRLPHQVHENARAEFYGSKSAYRKRVEPRSDESMYGRASVYIDIDEHPNSWLIDRGDMDFLVMSSMAIEALSTLTTNQRVMLDMKCSGYTIEEIGDHVGCSKQNVSLTIGRATRRLRGILGE
jgi:RNA polymerase sigma factor (sigma-70 family)